MKLVVPLAPLRRVLRWTRRGLLALGISLLGYTGFVLLDTWSFQREAGEQLDRLLARQPQEAVAARPASSPAPPVPPQAEPGGLMGRIEIPRNTRARPRGASTTQSHCSNIPSSRSASA